MIKHRLLQISWHVRLMLTALTWGQSISSLSKARQMSAILASGTWRSAPHNLSVSMTSSLSHSTHTRSRRIVSSSSWGEPLRSTGWIPWTQNLSTSNTSTQKRTWWRIIPPWLRLDLRPSWCPGVPTPASPPSSSSTSRQSSSSFTSDLGEP